MPELGSVLTYGGLVAAFAMLATGWSTVRQFAAQLSGYVVTSATFNSHAGWAVVGYARRRKQLAPVRWRYSMDWFRFRASGLVHARPTATLDGGLFVRLQGWPVFVRFDQGTDPHGPVRVRVTYLRGTIDADRLALEAIEEYQRHSEGTRYSADEALFNFDRFVVQRITGTADRQFVPDSTHAEGEGVAQASQPNGGAPAVPDEARRYSCRPVGFDWEELGPPMAGSGPLDEVALPPEATEVIADAQYWRRAGDWCRSRGVPWRRGYLFEGPPGTGKSVTVRALARSLGLPIYAFELSTLRDDELIRAWRRACNGAPAIALFEDFDNVYRGRDLVTTGPSFDCLLNCLSGVDDGDGVLVVFTSNHAEQIDPAIRDREGRVDCRVHFGPPDRAGRYKIASRILADWPAAVEIVAERTAGRCGAAVESVAIRTAWRLKFNERDDADADRVRAVAERACAGRSPQAAPWIDFDAEVRAMLAEQRFLREAKVNGSSSGEHHGAPNEDADTGSAGRGGVREAAEAAS